MKGLDNLGVFILLLKRTDSADIVWPGTPIQLEIVRNLSHRDNLTLSHTKNLSLSRASFVPKWAIDSLETRLITFHDVQNCSYRLG